MKKVIISDYPDMAAVLGDTNVLKDEAYPVLGDTNVLKVDEAYPREDGYVVLEHGDNAALIDGRFVVAMYDEDMTIIEETDL